MGKEENMAEEKEVIDDKINETDNLPEGKEEEKEFVPSEESHKLELENAELKGKVQAFEQIAKSSPRQESPDQNEIWKSNALNDINTLDDESFLEKYKYSKTQVSTSILQYDFQKRDAKHKEEIASLRAENRLVSQYSDFRKYQSEIDEALKDVAIEVKQDSERLSRVMERAYLAAAKNDPRPTKKEDGMERRSIQSSNFDKPKPRLEKRQEDSDEVPAEYAPICKAFGITSEKERKKYMESDHIETHFGDGYVLRDEKKGFEKVA